jgi:hypothetical protein
MIKPSEMKKPFINLLVASAISLLCSCDNRSKENSNRSKSPDIEKAEEQHHNEIPLRLDEGKRWKANPETTAGVDNMIALMNSFTDKNNVDAYDKLSENLKLEYAMIIQKCTMAGEAHDQLHNFLVPMNVLFSGLSSRDINKCQASYGTLKEHLMLYNNYFE